jgi:hypothetical protein
MNKKNNKNLEFIWYAMEDDERERLHRGTENTTSRLGKAAQLSLVPRACINDWGPRPKNSCVAEAAFLSL